MISFEDFQKIELRTAKVLEAHAHPNADKLLVLRVDLGSLGERQVVAGIRPWYDPESLTGQTVVIVANLEPATLRGEESQGMVLAVLDGDDVAILTTDREVGPGRQIL